MGKKTTKKLKCNICGKEVVNPLSKNHTNSQYHKNSQNVSDGTKILTPQSTQNFTDMIETRLSELEEMVKFIFTRLERIESKTNEPSIKPSTLDLDINVQNVISKLIKPGESISVDALTQAPELMFFNWKNIEKQLKDLIEEKIIDVTESESIKKIDGNFGKIILR